MRKYPEVIAEIGINHNGDPDTARALVDAAVQAGADWVKFQTFSTEHLTTTSAPLADYQRDTVTEGTVGGQHDMLRALELDHDSHVALKRYCDDRKIGFLSTPFDLPSLDFLVQKLGLETIKIGSGDLTNAPLLLAAARYRCHVILSTGMATTDEIEQALGVLAFGYSEPGGAPDSRAFQAAWRAPDKAEQVRQMATLLHCTSAYPTPAEAANIAALETVRSIFGGDVGYSDHTIGNVAAVAAVALGATMIEKHITLDKSQPGPDHSASCEPDELADLVTSVRAAADVLGASAKQLQPLEANVRRVARKSLVCAKPIREGEIFSTRNLTTKRPGNGVCALLYFDYLGRPAGRTYDKDELIDAD